MTHWALDLADYRRDVAESYGQARAGGPGPAAWQAWRRRRDLLIGTHPQSPLPQDLQRLGWETPFFAHDPAWRMSGALTPAADPATIEVAHSAAGSTRFTEVGSLALEGTNLTASLTLFWLDAYGGGLFLPFTDATSGASTYGGGRYLLDTAKGADLGRLEDGRLILDFNYA
ncbi:MAG TPA: DUF1684 domain-containing protein, partial [Euzebya sp.]|nr:DUF1684 domain-containing protein [Euzebya sp.]